MRAQWQKIRFVRRNSTEETPNKQGSEVFDLRIEKKMYVDYIRFCHLS